MIEKNKRMDIEESNINAYTTEVNSYKVNYFRPDEEKIISKYAAPGKKILVLGCGAGRTLPHLYKMGFQVTAIDYTPAMVTAAKEAVKNLPIEVSHQDAKKLKFEKNSFDVVFFPFHGIDYNSDIYAVIENARRVMKPQGVFIFNSHNRLFPKQLRNIFHPYAMYHKHMTFRTWPFATKKMRSLFKRVNMIGRIKAGGGALG